MPKETLYQAIAKSGQKFGSHMSDLYFIANDVTTAILAQYPQYHATTFTDQIDHEQWYDVPFAYDPYWKSLLS